MAKRKPPSQRAERVMDETARAIAREREAAKGEKLDGQAKLAQEKPSSGRLSQSVPASRKVDVLPAFPSTKRPKTG
jgi:hypothetical protein